MAEKLRSGAHSGQLAPLRGAAEGWYPDPIDSGSHRWWDGEQWSEHTAPASLRAAAAPPGPVQPARGLRLTRRIHVPWSIAIAVGLALQVLIAAAVIVTMREAPGGGESSAGPAAHVTAPAAAWP